jgi:hypothetical protein
LPQNTPYPTSNSISFIFILKDKGKKTRGRFACHILRIYIYLIVSSLTVKRICLFQFFYILILIRQRFIKSFFLKKIVARGKMDSHFHGNDIKSNEIAALSSKVRNDRSSSRDNKCRSVLQSAYY